MRKMMQLAVAVALAAALFIPTAAQAGPRIPAQQKLASLLGNHSVRSRPDGSAKTIANVKGSRPITGARTVLPILQSKTDKKKRRWLKVKLPGRILGVPKPPKSGWISASGTDQYINDWAIVVNRSARNVKVYRDGKVIHSYRAIVGKPSTPTPKGQFFVEENIRMPSSAAGAPFALATSGRSNVLQEFEGGPGQIALHGLGNVGGDLGTAQSHGCVRMADADITWLAKHVGSGTIVTIL